jgi:hypothetical protein
MWQNLGTDASPSWVALVKSGDLANYATIAAVNLKANIVSPALTGNPTAPTQTAGNDSTRIATTAFVAASFATTSAVAAGYQPLDSDLTAIAALATTSTGRALLTESVAQTGTGALVRAASPTLTGTLTAAAITASGKLTVAKAGSVSYANLVEVSTAGSNKFTVRDDGTVEANGVYCISNGAYGAELFNALFLHNRDGFYKWSGTVNWYDTKDLGFTRNAAGVLEINNGTAGTYRDLNLRNLTASGTLRVGGGTVVTNILSATATLDFPSIGSNDTETLTITVTGAVAGDSVFLGCPAGLDADLVFCASVTAADTVTVRMHNSTGSAIDPASATFRATVIRF